MNSIQTSTIIQRIFIYIWIFHQTVMLVEAEVFEIEERLRLECLSYEGSPKDDATGTNPFHKWAIDSLTGLDEEVILFLSKTYGFGENQNDFTAIPSFYTTSNYSTCKARAIPPSATQKEFSYKHIEELRPREAMTAPKVTYFQNKDTLILKCFSEEQRPENDADITAYQWTVDNKDPLEELDLKFYAKYDLGREKGDLLYLELPHQLDRPEEVFCEASVDGATTMTMRNQFILRRQEEPSVTMLVAGGEVEGTVSLGEGSAEVECKAERGVPLPSIAILLGTGDEEIAPREDEQESVSTTFDFTRDHHLLNLTCDVRQLHVEISLTVKLNISFAPVLTSPSTAAAEDELEVGASFSHTFFFRANPPPSNFSCTRAPQRRYTVFGPQQVLASDKESPLLAYTLYLEAAQKADLESCIECVAHNTLGSATAKLCLREPRGSNGWLIAFWILVSVLVVGAALLVIARKFVIRKFAGASLKPANPLPDPASTSQPLTTTT